MKTKQRKLGRNQQGVLDALRRHGSWHGRGWGCGWMWTSTLRTQRLLDTLVVRGLVKVDEQGTYTPVPEGD